MRALLLGTLLVVVLMSRATAQLAVGPVPITSSINGIPVTLSVTTWISVNSVGDEITVDARLRAFLQRRFRRVLALCSFFVDVSGDVFMMPPVVSTLTRLQQLDKIEIPSAANINTIRHWTAGSANRLKALIRFQTLMHAGAVLEV